MEHLAKGEEGSMSRMYRGDARDGKRVMVLLQKKKWKAASRKLDDMDTEPRDAVWVRIPKKIRNVIEESD